MSKKTFRPAIAMLELIFALVIIGITLMSAPMLIGTASKGSTGAIAQEAINAASSQINMVMGYHWDENSTDERFLDPILITSVTNIHLDEDGVTGRRKGTPYESPRRFVRSDGARLDATPITVGNIVKNDINDFAGDTNLRRIEVSLIDYVEKITMNLNTVISYSTDTTEEGDYSRSSITYNPFSDAASTTNIKTITVKVTSTSDIDELKKTIKMSAFSCNIGGYILAEKDL